MKQSGGIVLNPSIVMGRQMNYSLVSASKQKILLAGAVKLWTCDDIRSLISLLYTPIMREVRKPYLWQKIENEVVEKVSKLPLSDDFKDKLLYFIKPVGYQILSWIDYHDTCSDFITKLPNEFFWTLLGTIDRKKTAQALTKDESLDIVNRYKLACMYCLESDIHVLWNKIPESQRESLYSDEEPIDYRQQDLAVLWTCEIRGEMAKLNSVIGNRWRENTSAYQYAFEDAAMHGNLPAAEYLLPKLTPKERQYSLLETAGYVANVRKFCDSYTGLHKEYYADVLCFLLTNLTEWQQRNIFKCYPGAALAYFLCWPWQSLFIEVARRVFTFLPKDIFEFTLETLTDKVIEGYRDCDYRKMFGEFWQESPVDHKMYVTDKCGNGILLSKLFSIEDRENIASMLKYATVAEREKWVFNKLGHDVVTRALYRKKVKWNLLEFFVCECVSSREMCIELKEKFKKRNTWLFMKGTLEEIKDDWDRFYLILDTLFEKYNRKRSLEEGSSSSPAKRLESESS